MTYGFGLGIGDALISNPRLGRLQWLPVIMNKLEVRLTELAVRKRNLEADVRVGTGTTDYLRRLVLSVFFVSAGLAVFWSVQARSQDAQAAASQGEASSPVATIQLNKLEDVSGGCRVYFVLSNKMPDAIKTLKIDLILFRTDGVIGKRFFADMAPLRAGSKQQVKLFDLGGTKCSEVGSLLINDALECRSETGVVDKCYSRLEASHIGKVSLSK